MRSGSRGLLSNSIPESAKTFAIRRMAEIAGLTLLVADGALAIALATWSTRDPSFNHATAGAVRNLLGRPARSLPI